MTYKTEERVMLRGQVNKPLQHSISYAQRNAFCSFDYINHMLTYGEQGFTLPHTFIITKLIRCNYSFHLLNCELIISEVSSQHGQN